MSKVQQHQVDGSEIEENLQEYCKYISRVDDPRFLRRYYQSLFTESELIMISRRIEIAKNLIKGKTYEEIIEKMKVGVTTVRNVNDGLKKFLVNENKSRELMKKHQGPDGPFEEMRKKYKGYFALINALLDK